MRTSIVLSSPLERRAIAVEQIEKEADADRGHVWEGDRHPRCRIEYHPYSCIELLPAHKPHNQTPDNTLVSICYHPIAAILPVHWANGTDRDDLVERAQGNVKQPQSQGCSKSTESWLQN